MSCLEIINKGEKRDYFYFGQKDTADLLIILEYTNSQS